MPGVLASSAKVVGRRHWSIMSACPADEQRSHRGLFLDRPVGHAGDLAGLPAAPVRRERLHHERGRPVPRLHRVRTGARRLLPEIGLPVVAELPERPGLLVGQDLVPVHDEELGQRREERGVGLVEREHDRSRPARPHLLGREDVVPQPGEALLQREHPLEREDDVVGRQLLAVVELDPLADLERVGLSAVRDPPRRRDVGTRLHGVLPHLRIEERVVHVDDGVEGALVRVLGGIDRGDLLPLQVREADVLTLGGGEAGPHEDERRDENSGQGSVHGAPPATGWPRCGRASGGSTTGSVAPAALLGRTGSAGRAVDSPSSPSLRWPTRLVWTPPPSRHARSPHKEETMTRATSPRRRASRRPRARAARGDACPDEGRHARLRPPVGHRQLGPAQLGAPRGDHPRLPRLRPPGRP